jgi:drug/metabolite transporter (DMT)-like permease
MGRTEPEGKSPAAGPTLRAAGVLLLVNVLWGVSFPVMKMIDQVMARHEPAPADSLSRLAGAGFYTAVRFAVSLVLLAVLLPRLFRGLTGRHWLMGAGVGLPFFGGFLLQYMALREIPASRSGFLTSLTVVFTPLVILAAGRRPRRSVLAGAALAVLGTAVLTGVCEVSGAGLRLADDVTAQVGPGDGLTVLAALLFTGQIFAVDRFSRAMPPEKLTPGMFVAVTAAAALVSAACGWGEHVRVVRAAELDDPGFLQLTLVTSLFCTVLAFYLMNKYQGRLAPSHAALIYTAEPVCATLWAMLLPDLLSPHYNLAYASESPGMGLVVGGGLVLLGNLVALRR